MFNSEKHIIYTALTGWAKYIETGSFSSMDKSTMIKLALSDKDMQRILNRLPQLSVEQEIFVNMLRELATKQLDTPQLNK